MEDKRIKIKFNKFISKSISIHGDKFDYSNFKYINSSTYGIITCKIHGDFLQSPYTHTSSIHACPSCANEARSSLMKSHREVVKYNHVLSHESDYIRKYDEKFGNTYKLLIDNWKGSTHSTVNVICETHGITTHNASVLLNTKYPCKLCGTERVSFNRTCSYEDIKSRFSDKYKFTNLYLSSDNETTYKNSASILKIICPLHGEFYKTVNHLMNIGRNDGCKYCKREEKIMSGRMNGVGYTYAFFEKNPEMLNVPAKLYMLKVDDLYKIGVTRNSIEYRLNRLKSSSRNYVENIEILQVENTTLLLAFKTEQFLLNENKSVRIVKDWSSELFSEDILKEKSLSFYLTYVNNL